MFEFLSFELFLLNFYENRSLFSHTILIVDLLFVKKNWQKNKKYLFNFSNFSIIYQFKKSNWKTNNQKLNLFKLYQLVKYVIWDIITMYLWSEVAELISSWNGIQ